jgi:hypothetical protein
MSFRLSRISAALAGLALFAGVALLAMQATKGIEAAADSPLPDSAKTAPLAPATQRNPRYVLPIAGANPAVSSTFGEYRPGHFHAGVDFSTGGQVGIPVLAIDDGHVVRVRASALGYGRAIYLKLRDGRLAVYAHLSSYMPELARYVESAQDSLGRYRVDLWPAADRFPVKRGETIGHSGRSGAGGPHFHFEMREGDIALNPMSHGLVLEDARMPLLHALYFTPLTSAARVNGAAQKLRVPLVQGTGGALTARETIELQGPVAVSLQAHDPGLDAENRLGIYRLELKVDDVLVFKAQFDRIDYLRNHEVEAQYDYEEALRGRRSVQNLFVPAGVTGDHYGGLRAGAGILVAGEERAGDRAATAIPPGAHVLRVVAADAAGKRSEAQVSVRAKAPSEPQTAARLASSAAATGASSRTPRLELRPDGRMADAILDFGGPVPQPRIGEPSPAEVHTLGPGRYRVRFDALGQPALVLANGAGADSGAAAAGARLPLDWLRAPAGKAVEGKLAGGRVWAELPAHAFFEDAYLWAAEDPKPPALPAGLRAVSPVFALEPGILPLDQGLWLGIRMEAPADSDGVGLYRFDRGDWDHEGAEVRPGGILGGTVKRLSHFVLARDVVPPHAAWLSPTAERLSTGAKPLLRARVRDGESGFREDDVTFYIDGRRVPAEWDPDAGDLRYTPRSPLAPGAHTFAVEARDRAGLVTRRELSITVKP